MLAVNQAAIFVAALWEVPRPRPFRHTSNFSRRPLGSCSVDAWRSRIYKAAKALSVGG